MRSFFQRASLIGPPVPDPFEDKQKFSASPKTESDLEVAEKMQSEVLEALSQGGESQGTAAQTKSQAKVVKKLSEAAEKLLAQVSTPEEVNETLGKAQEAAKQALEQLEAHDPGAAREPATRSLQEIRAALESVKQQAATAFANTQTELNNAAGKMQQSDTGNDSKDNESTKPEDTEATKQMMTQLSDALYREATRQQEVGSGKIAHQLDQLAGEVGKTPQTGNSAEQKRLRALAMHAAAEQLSLISAKQAFTETLSQLHRIQANIDNILPPVYEESSKNGQQATQKSSEKAFATELLEDLEAAAQKSMLLLQSPQAEELANALIAASSDLGKGRDGILVNSHPKMIQEPLARLIALLEQRLLASARSETISQLKEEEAPAAYQAAVARYFERLSREETDYKNE